MSDAGETTDDGCESPILCVSRTATYAAKAVKCAVPPHNRPEEAGSTEGDEADEADGANGADDANEADDADEGRDVFDSQGRRFYGPALQANNVMLSRPWWFRAECDYALRTRLALRRDSLISWRSTSCQAPVFPSSRLPVCLSFWPTACACGSVWSNPPHAHAFPFDQTHRTRMRFCLINPPACACVSV